MSQLFLSKQFTSTGVRCLTQYLSDQYLLKCISCESIYYFVHFHLGVQEVCDNKALMYNRNFLTRYLNTNCKNDRLIRYHLALTNNNLNKNPPHSLLINLTMKSALLITQFIMIVGSAKTRQKI